MECVDIQPHLIPLIKGEIPWLLALRLEAHIKNCPVCSKAYHNVKESIQTLGYNIDTLPSRLGAADGAMSASHKMRPKKKKAKRPLLPLLLTFISLLIILFGISVVSSNAKHNQSAERFYSQ